MTKFEIWAEPYACAPEDHGPSIRMGIVDAETFREACLKLAEIDPSFAANFNPEQLSNWARRLYPTRIEADAGWPKWLTSLGDHYA